MADSGGDDSAFRSLFKSGSIVFVGFVVEMGIAFLAKAIAARELARADYGSVAAGMTILATAGSLTLLGLNKGVGRYLPRFDAPRKRRGVLVSALQLSLPVALAAAAGLFLFADPVARRVFNDPGTAAVLRVFALAIPFSVLTKVAIGTIQGSQQTMPKVYIQNLALPISRFGLVVGFVLLGLGVVGIAWAYVLPHVLAGVLGLYFVYRRTDLLDSTRYVPRRREMLAFSAPLVVTGIMAQVLSDLDTYLIGYLVGIGPVGTYNVVYPLAEIVNVVLVSFGYFVVPLLSELQANAEPDADASATGNRVDRIYTVATKWILLGTLPLFLGLFLFPELAISLTFGAKYAGGALALRILVLGFFFRAFLGPNANALTAFGRTRPLMYYNVGAAALNAALNVALIPRFGIAGAALATLASYLLLNLCYSVDLHRSYGISPLAGETVWPAAAATAVVVASFLIARAAFADPVVVLVAVVLPSALLYPPIIVRFGGVGDEEIMIVESVEDRFGINLGRVKRLFGRLT